VKIALDPYMHRRLSLRQVTHLVAELGYSHIEMSPRSDFLPFFVHARADSDRIRELKEALKETGLFLASLLPLYRCPVRTKKNGRRLSGIGNERSRSALNWNATP
jgi:myo-inositol catabolism protein IolH